MAISARWKAGGSFLSPREQMDCNGESDRKDDEPWQHDCEGNCISVHVYLALQSGAASLPLHVGTDCAPCASFTRGTYGSPPILLISRTIITVLQKVYYCNHCYTLMLVVNTGKGSLR
jgi:hypothetical protein